MTSADSQAEPFVIGRPSREVLRAFREEIGLSDQVLSRVVDRSAQTVRRWRRGDDASDIPDGAAVAIDDLRAIVAKLLEAGVDTETIKQFLLSRNIGLGQDRPIDGVRAGLDGFRRVEHVTECFIAGVAPEPGPSLVMHDGEEFEPAIIEPSVTPDLPHRPAKAGR